MGSQFPNPGLNLCPPAVEVQSLNHWTTREVPEIDLNDGKDVVLLGCLTSARPWQSLCGAVMVWALAFEVLGLRYRLAPCLPCDLS